MDRNRKSYSVHQKGEYPVVDLQPILQAICAEYGVTLRELTYGLQRGRPIGSHCVQLAKGEFILRCFEADANPIAVARILAMSDRMARRWYADFRARGLQTRRAA